MPMVLKQLEPLHKSPSDVSFLGTEPSYVSAKTREDRAPSGFLLRNAKAGSSHAL